MARGRRDPRADAEAARGQGPRRASRPASSTRRPRSSSARRARRPAFKGYRGFPGSICASPNSMVVHGIPGPYRLRAATSSASTSASSRTAGSPTRRARSRSGRSRRWPRKLLDIDEGVAVRRRRAVPARQPPRRRLARRAGTRRGRGHVDRPLARRPRHRPRHARGPADPQLRRSRPRAAARGGHGPGRRADGQRRPPPVRMGDDGWAIYSAGRLARRALRVHDRDHRRRARGS